MEFLNTTPKNFMMYQLNGVSKSIGCYLILYKKYKLSMV